MAAETLTDLMQTDGLVRIEWTNAGISPQFYAYRVYRRLMDEDWELLYSTSVSQANYSYDDVRAPQNVPIEYDVVQATIDNSVVSEEGKSPSTITPAGNDYWLIHPTNAALTMRLYHVTEDSFEDEYEEEVMELLNRGRKVDQGTEFGVTGSMTAEFRDVHNGPTGREQQTSLRSLKRTKSYLYLRNPFGDVWKINLGQISFDRLSGVGVRDFASVSIPYIEVA